LYIIIILKIIIRHFHIKISHKNYHIGMFQRIRF